MGGEGAPVPEGDGRGGTGWVQLEERSVVECDFYAAIRVRGKITMRGHVLVLNYLGVAQNSIRKVLEVY